jgi:smad nuclear-interacting protein 1
MRDHRDREEEKKVPPSMSKEILTTMTSRDRSHSPRRSASPEVKKTKINLELTGKLAQETNLVQGVVVVKYNEPVEAKLSPIKWRIYIFKGQEQLDVYHVHRKTSYLIGKDRRVVDIPIDHPSCSKQHAALQYREMVDEESRKSVDEVAKRHVLPYLIDLDSANGTTLNGEKMQSSRYYEIKNGDVVKFAYSTREYVFLKEDAE